MKSLRAHDPDVLKSTPLPQSVAECPRLGHTAEQASLLGVVPVGVVLVVGFRGTVMAYVTA